MTPQEITDRVNGWIWASVDLERYYTQQLRAGNPERDWSSLVTRERGKRAAWRELLELLDG